MKSAGKILPLLLLAAGKSSRMGSPKGLFQIKEKPWIRWQLEKYFESDGPETTVVLGHHGDLYKKCLLDIDNIKFVTNTNPELGPFSSLQSGLKGLNSDVILLPLDVPLPSAKFLISLSKFNTNIWVNSPQKGGHPIALSKQFIRYILDRNPTSRLDQLIEALPGIKKNSIAAWEHENRLNLNYLKDFIAFANTHSGPNSDDDRKFNNYLRNF